MTYSKNNQPFPAWSGATKLTFRFAFVFFVLLAFPLDWKYWRELLSTHWLYFQDIFRLTAYSPQLISVPKWGIASYGNWAILLLIAIFSGLVWSYIDRNRKEYTNLYYWLRVLLRYRLAIGIIGYGMIKLFPLQFPHPTLSDLNTNYGDFLPWKIYYLTTGAASAYYEQALGLIEIVAGILLFWRRLTAIGAGLTAALLINIVLVNFAYQLGDHVYASLLLLIAIFLLLHDARRLFDLLIRERLAKADQFEPAFTDKRLKNARIILRAVVALFIAVYGASAFASYHRRDWPFPEAPGLKDIAGLYNVQDFEINGKVLPYSLTDPVRWQNVVFEKWNTLSIRIHRPVTIDVANPVIAYQPDDQRDYEFAGNGGRHFYSYTADPAKGTIALQGRNDKNEKFFFKYHSLDDGDLLLTGNDQAGNSLRIVLEKTDKKYLLLVGRRNPVSLY